MRFFILILLVSTQHIAVANLLNEKLVIKKKISGEIKKDLPKQLAEGAYSTEAIIFYIGQSGSVHVEHVESNNNEPADYLKSKLEGFSIPSVSEYAGFTFCFALKLMIQ